MSSYDGALAGADIGGIAALETPEECRGICVRAHPVLEKISALRKPVQPRQHLLDALDIVADLRCVAGEFLAQ